MFWNHQRKVNKRQFHNKQQPCISLFRPFRRPYSIRQSAKLNPVFHFSSLRLGPPSLFLRLFLHQLGHLRLQLGQCLCLLLDPLLLPELSSFSSSPLLARRIRSDLQIGEVESPERELLRTQSSPEKSPYPSSPLNVKSLPSPAPLVFTPLKTKDQSDILEIAEAVEVDEADTALSCSNCEGIFTPGHQCGDSPAPLNTTSKCAVLGKELPTPAPLPLCHYCCHLGSGLNPVHYYLQCLCADKVCSCQCYCTEEQLKHKRKFFSSGFIGNNCVDINDRPRAKAIAEARANKLDYRGIPMAQRPCEAETCIRM